ncbi:ABC transporter substrate-binding protein [Microtetraspora fusca]|uniref:ABC transporter substrate-binding protein n=1 Tax=Microtetraspora fusca TaxID=1997 RepID=UPI000830B62C|nr:ABC transporter substrate-binding protein [Microtetraspora fusca]
MSPTTSPRSRSRGARIRLAAAAISAAALLAACGGGEVKAPAGPGGSVGTAPSGPADPTATLRFSFGTDAGKNYDPVTAANQFVNTFLLPVYDRLFDIDAQGKVIPLLAENTQVGADGKTLTLTLRRDVTFHDGAPFDAAAVKANLERAKTAERSSLKGDLAVVTSIDAPDRHTVVLHLAAPTASLPALLADRAGMMISPRALDNPDLDLMPVGAGPYKVVEDQPGAMIVYERYDGYWNKSAVANAAKRIELRVQLNPETRLRAVEAGEDDATLINVDQYAAAAATGKHQVLVQHGTGALLVYLNMARNPALAKPEVRAALSAAIDREGISRSILGGQCIVSPQIFPGGYWAAAPNLSANASAFDVTAAKQKLADAGFPNGFAMSMTVVNGAPYSTVAEAIASQFEQIGVKVDLQIAEPAQVIAAFTGQKSADSYVGLWPGAVDPARTVASLYLPTGTFNPGAAQDPEIVRLAGEGLAAPDDATRAGVYQRLSARAVDQHVHLPICSAPSVIMASAKVRGLSSTISGTPDLRAVEITRG